MRSKYGIQDCDFYNFDKTGFMMGMIRPRMVVTRSDRIGKPKNIQPGNRVYRILVVNSYESHVSSDFEEYCKENKIITLCLPSHSSHLTQPLDVRCYSALKLRYSSQIEHFIKARITHITKPEFFLAFKAAFLGAGLIPYDPQAVLLKLNVQLRTPTAPNTPVKSPNTWVSKTPQTTNEALCQSSLIKERISRHQGSSLTPIYDAVNKLSKGLQSVSHLTALLQEEVQYLRDANTALSKRRRAKRTRLQDSGALDGSQAREIMTEKGIIEEEGCEEEKNEGSSKRRRRSLRHCGICRKTGHNVRTCPETEEISDSSDSE
ncbi:hypothetical protein CCHR01_19109 [Colletotrichum chrysophilum]|uniref:DDE-1 domain-containing protein n=1 Tax=Colletotrichum chrysophilum TaxID=1836956 RepID=A0AAD9A165_9PEZI|nr:hypothetical protein CCHR01_19109 [Colletotrichum chrysophilum]